MLILLALVCPCVLNFLKRVRRFWNKGFGEDDNDEDGGGYLGRLLAVVHKFVRLIYHLDLDLYIKDSGVYLFTVR